MTTTSRPGNISAGLLMFRYGPSQPLAVFLAHPGGPFFRNKDEGAWTIPKGLIETGEDPLDAAVREFTEETGLMSEGPYLPLTPVKQKGGKTVMAWAFQGDVAEPIKIRPNTFTLEWPPRSGRVREFPEIDFAGFFTVEEARRKLNPAQVALVEELERLLAERDPTG
jgi:predicted NUDIX family NTP pyrophosphohydrolase